MLFTATAENSKKQRLLPLLFGRSNRRKAGIPADYQLGFAVNLRKNSEKQRAAAVLMAPGEWGYRPTPSSN
jgi:hypothetical protein